LIAPGSSGKSTVEGKQPEGFIVRTPEGDIRVQLFQFRAENLFDRMMKAARAGQLELK
jgi:hypothetical protein